MSGEWNIEDDDEALDFSPPPSPKKAKAGVAEDYHATYYERNKDKLSDRAAARWRLNEGGYRERGLARARSKRAQKRAERADAKFRTQVANFRTGWECRGCHHHTPTESPRCPACNAEGMNRVILVTVALCSACERTLPWDGEVRPCALELHGGGVCPGKLEEGEKVLVTKPPRYDGEWLFSSGTLAAVCGKSPSTMRTWIENRVVPGYSRLLSGRYWFTMDFMQAVAEGYRKTLFIDGRAPHKTLRRWVRGELEERAIPYEPFPPR